jgi:hypothetical protein
MLKPEDFKEIIDTISKEETLSKEQIQSMLTTIYELDANLVIVQYALELAVGNAVEVIPAVAEKVLSMSGRTDSKSKQKAAKYAAEVTARFELAIQMYISGASEQAAEMLTKIASGEISMFEETTEEDQLTTAQEAENE